MGKDGETNNLWFVFTCGFHCAWSSNSWLLIWDCISNELSAFIMYTAQDIYKKLVSSEGSTHHLVLAGLFELVFGRKLKRNEWGMIRKLIRIYGSEIVYWAILASAKATGPTPLVYTLKVCKGILEQAVAPETDDMLEARTQKRLNELRQIKEELNG